jgi:hypothetical protein
MATTTTDSATITEGARELTTGGIWKGATFGAAIGAAANALLYEVGFAAGISMVVPVGLGAGQIIVASVVPAVLAALLSLLLNRFFAKPSTVLVGVAIAFGLVSLIGPTRLAGAGAALRLLLGSMHVVSGVAIVGGIRRFGRRG